MENRDQIDCDVAGRFTTLRDHIISGKVFYDALYAMAMGTRKCRVTIDYDPTESSDPLKRGIFEIKLNYGEETKDTAPESDTLTDPQNLQHKTLSADRGENQGT